MRIKWSRFWHKVNYGDKRKFKFWSPQVNGMSDKALAKDSSLKDWKKVIILRPIGDPKTTFSIGFKDILGNTKVSSAVRRVGEGSFRMRMGPENCDFFIVSNKNEVGLEFVEYANISDETKSKLPLY